MLREQLAVQIDPVQMDVPQIEQMDVEILPPKQQIKKNKLSKFAIVIILAMAAILALGAYSFLDASEMEAGKGGISATHDKIIHHGQNSKSEGSKDSTQGSKASNSNLKPNSKSLTASKGVISSNPSLNGAGGDDPDQNDEDDGDKRDRKLKKGSSTSGRSTDEESSQDSSEVEEEEEVYWVDPRMKHGPSPPLVGERRRPRI